MSRNIVFSMILVSGFIGGTLLAGDGLSLQPAPLSAAEAQPAPPGTGAQPAEQSDVTERGLPGAPAVRPLPKLPASPAMSPDQAARAALESLAASTQSVQQPRPGIRELLEILRALPGGAQVIEDAKRRGARLTSIAIPPPANWYSWANPFEPSAAEAAEGFSVTLSPGHLSEPSREGGHYLSLVGMSISGLHNYETPGAFKLYNTRHASGSQIMKPYAMVHVSVPRDGWYLINFQMFFWNGLATLKRFVPPDQYPVIQTFDYRTRPRGQFSFPALLELAAGRHDFYLAIEAGSASFFEASVTLL